MKKHVTHMIALCNSVLILHDIRHEFVYISMEDFLFRIMQTLFLNNPLLSMYNIFYLQSNCDIWLSMIDWRQYLCQYLSKQINFNE